jgi:hypothetical protein
MCRKRWEISSFSLTFCAAYALDHAWLRFKRSGRHCQTCESGLVSLNRESPGFSRGEYQEQRLRSAYGDAVFATMVPYATDFKEAIAARQTIDRYKPKGASAKVLRALADELIGRIQAGTLLEGEAP